MANWRSSSKDAPDRKDTVLRRALRSYYPHNLVKQVEGWRAIVGGLVKPNKSRFNLVKQTSGNAPVLVRFCSQNCFYVRLDGRSRLGPNEGLPQLIEKRFNLVDHAVPPVLPPILSRKLPTGFHLRWRDRRSGVAQRSSFVACYG